MFLDDLGRKLIVTLGAWLLSAAPFAIVLVRVAPGPVLVWALVGLAAGLLTRHYLEHILNSRLYPWRRRRRRLRRERAGQPAIWIRPRTWRTMNPNTKDLVLSLAGSWAIAAAAAGLIALARS
ncbi:hypothetical protein [Kitasatospora sp. NPDC002040]|uniref:hypothetical protein n=1 Tax=Kitasatospora sp. NPDC002040 TaxID=3154661 RepID=UPI0033166F01